MVIGFVEFFADKRQMTEVRGQKSESIGIQPFNLNHVPKHTAAKFSHPQPAPRNPKLAPRTPHPETRHLQPETSYETS